MNEPIDYLEHRYNEEAEIQPIRDAMDEEEYVMEQFDAYCDEGYYENSHYYPTDEELEEMAKIYCAERMMA